MWLVSCCISYYGDPEAIFWRQVFEDQNKRAHAARIKADDKPIIFVGGGSSCSFSIHADVLTETTGLQAVNLGGSAGMGYRFLIDLATRHAKRGDIVILHLEPEIFQEHSKKTSPLGIKIDLPSGVFQNGHGAYLGNLYEEPIKEKIKALKPGAQFFGVLAAKVARRGPMYRYQINEIRENGSLSIKVAEPNTDIEPFKEMTSWAKTKGIQSELEWLAQYAQENDIQIFFTLPWESYRNEALEKQRAEHARYLDEIEKKLPVLRDEMMGAVGDNSLFLDSGFHMTTKGGLLRSRALGESLNFALSTQ